MNELLSDDSSLRESTEVLVTLSVADLFRTLILISFLTLETSQAGVVNVTIPDSVGFLEVLDFWTDLRDDAYSLVTETQVCFSVVKIRSAKTGVSLVDLAGRVEKIREEGSQRMSSCLTPVELRLLTTTS